MKGRISEVFDSIQGEGPYFGEKQLFIRFFGCNLCCRFCDTRLTSFFEYSPEELFREIELYQDEYHSISLTGGEPLLQHAFLGRFLALSKAAGYKNYLETNGTLPGELQEVIEYADIIAMDFKLPTSSGMGNLWGLHRRFLKIANKKEVFLKAIICEVTQPEDIDQAVKLIAEVNKNLTLILQPNSFDSYAMLVSKLKVFKNICTKSGINSRIIPQMHKLAGIK